MLGPQARGGGKEKQRQQKWRFCTYQSKLFFNLHTASKFTTELLSVAGLESASANKSYISLGKQGSSKLGTVRKHSSSSVWSRARTLTSSPGGGLWPRVLHFVTVLPPLRAACLLLQPVGKKGSAWTWQQEKQTE